MLHWTVVNFLSLLTWSEGKFCAINQSNGLTAKPPETPTTEAPITPEPLRLMAELKGIKPKGSDALPTDLTSSARGNVSL